MSEGEDREWLGWGWFMLSPLVPSDHTMKVLNRLLFNQRINGGGNNGIELHLQVTVLSIFREDKV